MGTPQDRDAVLVARHVDAAGRLVSMPAKRSRRLLVLAAVAERIPAGQDLDEVQVNALLRPVSDDVAALRRYLVDEGFLERLVPGHYRREQEESDDADRNRP